MSETCTARILPQTLQVLFSSLSATVWASLFCCSFDDKNPQGGSRYRQNRVGGGSDGARVSQGQCLPVHIECVSVCVWMLRGEWDFRMCFGHFTDAHD